MAWLTSFFNSIFGGSSTKKKDSSYLATPVTYYDEGVAPSMITPPPPPTPKPTQNPLPKPVVSTPPSQNQALINKLLPSTTAQSSLLTPQQGPTTVIGAVTARPNPNLGTKILPQHRPSAATSRTLLPTPKPTATPPPVPLPQSAVTAVQQLDVTTPPWVPQEIKNIRNLNLSTAPVPLSTTIPTPTSPTGGSTPMLGMTAPSTPTRTTTTAPRTTTQQSATQWTQPVAQPPVTTQQGGATEYSGTERIRESTRESVSVIDNAITELKDIANRSLIDPEMTALVNSFMDSLNSALAQIQGELQQWYQQSGGQQDLGLQNAIQILQEEINTQKAQLEESLNARGLLQSGIMAAAEAKLRGGGLDRTQQLIANRLSELSGVIMQSVTSLAQTRMAALTDITATGLGAVTDVARAREQTRGAAINEMANLYGTKADIIQRGAATEVSAAQAQQELSQQWATEQLRQAQAQQELEAQRWYQEQQARNAAEQNRIMQEYYRGLLSNQRAEMQMGVAATDIAPLSNAMAMIDSGQYSEEDFNADYNRLLLIDPQMADIFQKTIENYLRRTNQTFRRTSNTGNPVTNVVNPSTATGIFGGSLQTNQK